MMICLFCLQEFEPTNNRHKYCCFKCGRLDRSGSPCIDCGLIIYSKSPKDSRRCDPCNRIHRKVSSQKRIINAIQEWVTIYGDIPSATDWNIADHNHHGMRMKRYAEYGPWPASSTVFQAFGSWNAGIEAAGFRPRPTPASMVSS